MSWKALDWATESDIGSPTTKFVLHLLANKADEEFTCYPSIRTLMAESGARRSTVMRALQELQAEGFPLEPPIRTTNRTSIRRHQGAGRSAGSLAGWQEGCRNPDTRHRGRASVGLDPPDPHPTHRTQTRRRPKPRTGPGSTPRRPTPSAPRSCPPTIAWCGGCEDERSRTITIDMPDGTEAAAFCPRCSPQAQRKARDHLHARRK